MSPVQATSDLMVPNRGNGYDRERYSWAQDLKEVTVTVPVPNGTKVKDIVVEISTLKIKIGIKGQQPILDGELHKAIIKDNSFWQLEDKQNVVIYLAKHNGMEWWSTVVKGEPLVDTKKIDPESSSVRDLDDETRSFVEQIMSNQKTKQNSRTYD